MAIWFNYRMVNGLQVSNEGEVRRIHTQISRIGFRTTTTTPLKRHADKNGNIVVKVNKPYRQELRVDEMVAHCFYRDVKRTSPNQTLLIHKDGNMENCRSGNLKWATPYEYGNFYADDPAVNTLDGFRLVKYSLYVSKDGDVKLDDLVQSARDSFYDPDMGREAAVSPFIYNGAKREYIEDLVASAYLPEPTGMSNPGLLHIDNNYKNCSVSNLKWVESDSNEYRNYLSERNGDIAKRQEELNPHPVTHLLAHVM